MALLQISEPGLSAAPHQRRLAAGIDLGTTNSLVATVRSGQAETLPDHQGRYLLPSVVNYQASGLTVGYDARQNAALDPVNTISSVKRMMGRSLADIEARYPHLPYQLQASENGLPMIQTTGGLLNPIRVSADILKALAERATEALAGELDGVVITVPAYFDDAQRQGTKDAARLAGLHVLRLLNEPTAAAIAYGLDSGQEGVIAVYDLGGGTFDISVLRLSRGVFEVLATGGDSALGGDDFDHLLADYLREQAGLSDRSDNRLQRELLDAAIAAKIALSDAETARVNVGGWQGEVTRSQFNALIAPLVKRTLLACRRALKDAGVEAQEVLEVVMVGGSTRVPLVRERVGEFFGPLSTRIKSSPSARRFRRISWWAISRTANCCCLMSFRSLWGWKPWVAWWKRLSRVTPPFRWRARRSSLPSKMVRRRCLSTLCRASASWCRIAAPWRALRCAAFRHYRRAGRIFA